MKPVVIALFCSRHTQPPRQAQILSTPVSAIQDITKWAQLVKSVPWEHTRLSLEPTPALLALLTPTPSPQPATL